MSFTDSLLAWLALILIVAILLFVVFTYILGSIYPKPKDREDRELQLTDRKEIEDSNLKQANSPRRMIGIFVLVFLIIIMATTGFNAFMAKT